MHHKSVSIIVQLDATVYSFIEFSAGSSTCFGWYPHPSSGAHSNCNYNIWHWSNRICYCPLTWKSQNSILTPPRQRMVANTVRPVPDVVITVWKCFWWWMKVSSETCRAVCRKYNETLHSRISLDNYWHWFTMHATMNTKFLNFAYNTIGFPPMQHQNYSNNQSKMQFLLNIQYVSHKLSLSSRRFSTIPQTYSQSWGFPLSVHHEQGSKCEAETLQDLQYGDTSWWFSRLQSNNTPV